jgi:FKBP-type peptidyl-prolyl cis-trans isomerase FklB
MKIKLMAFSLLSCGSLIATEPVVKKDVPTMTPAPVPAMEKKIDEEPTFDKKKVSYALGFNYGKALSKNDKDIDLSEIVKGLQDGLNPSAKPRFDEKETQDILMTYYTHIRKVFAEEQDKQKVKNMEAGKAFLEKNKTQTGVVTDSSGLQYKIISEGTGPTPKNDDSVEIEVKAKTIDGNVFFDTKVEGQPAHVVVSRVIPGWAIALQKMKKGATWELYVPPELGYGDKSVSEEIGPNSTLVFEVHLVDIKPEAEATKVPLDIK